jgi:type I restriction enzyme S subunit
MRPDNPGDKSLPPGWDAFSLGSRASFVTSGSRGWARFYTETGDLFLRSQNVRSGRLDLEDRQHVLPPAGAEGERTRVQPNDLLVTITGNSVGNVAISSVDLGIAYISQHVGLIRLVNPSLAPYACWYLSPGAPGNRQIMDAQTGQSKPGLNLQNLKDLVVAAPKDKRERDLIVTALDDIQAQADEMQMLLSKKRMLKQAAMQELLTGNRRLPGFEGKWKEASIGGMIDLLTGFPFPSSGYRSSGIRLLRGSNVKRGLINWNEDLAEHWPAISSDIARYELCEGDIVIAMDGALVGRSYARVQPSDLPALLLQRVARIRSSSLCNDFLFFQIGSSRFADHCDSVKTSTAIPHISPADIRNFRTFIPPTKKEQNAIAAILLDLDAELSGLEAHLDKARDLKQGMMQQLLTGKIRLT